MTKSERRDIYFHCFTEQTQLCANCEHFHQHYRKDGFPIFAGHCCYPRIKNRKPDDTCKHFQNKEDTR